jgi:hypothetical protein
MKKTKNRLQMSLSIYPALGLGDLLLWKLYIESTGQQVERFYFNNDIVNRFRCNPNGYREFLLYFIAKLFPKSFIIQCAQLHIAYPPTPFPTENLKSLYLYDKYTFDFPKPEIPTQPYIVIHMKARFLESMGEHFRIHDLPVIEQFCKTFQSKYTLMLMGDRNPEPNYENMYHKVCSIYDCFTLCKEKNEVIDRTKDNLCSGTDIREFEEDIHLMNGAVCNIVFGYGGPCTLANVFTKQNICYIKTLEHWGLDLYEQYNDSMIRDLNTFFEKIRNL